MKGITIAIDGFSSTGKSTLAKQLAKSLEYIYVDTGAMYRAVTLYAIEQGFINGDTIDEHGLIQNLEAIQLKFIYNETIGIAEIYLNDRNVEREIRTLEVSKKVSEISEFEEVRVKLVDLQKEMGTDKGVVMDGRDIGTTVFPHAELKIFMTAAPDKRAHRRYKELLDKGEVVTFKEVLENVEKRDYIDSNRKFSPLRKASEAIELDNSDMGLEEQFQRIHGFALRTIAKVNSI